MREFTSNEGMTAAIITGFNGPVVLTDDGDEIRVGDGWIGQRMPKEGDAIFLANGNYELMAKRILDERFEVPPPLEPVEPPVEPPPVDPPPPVEPPTPGTDPQVGDWVLTDGKFFVGQSNMPVTEIKDAFGFEKQETAQAYADHFELTSVSPIQIGEEPKQPVETPETQG